MAFVAADVPFVLNVTLYAKNGRKIVKPYNLVATTSAAAVTATATILAALAGVSAGGISGYSIQNKFEFDGSFALPSDDDAKWGANAIVSGHIDGHPLKPVSTIIPMPQLTLFQGTSGKALDLIDTNFSNETTTHLNAYLDLFRTGGVCTISDGELWDSDGELEGRRL